MKECLECLECFYTKTKKLELKRIYTGNHMLICIVGMFPPFEGDEKRYFYGHTSYHTSIWIF